MSGGTDKKVQVKAAKMAKLAILDVIGLVSNIKVGNNPSCGLEVSEKARKIGGEGEGEGEGE
ncbi:hypothetical protein DEJ70_02610 [Wolbachia pipientis wAlbB]|uniref:hypothetical protein n=1 Tax=Wolbachia pipientis TaxID=955 RepID=UPI00101AC606|nr:MULTISPECIES: hypothetical protein [Wolbachia]QBB83718.1 hypothetical protein DEJ70_02610 [Wolbachia pipientis wAlbB]QDW08524.1 hypothetical protein CO539_002600 [Wolbachia pipientis]QDW09714.1 hypothetical protein CO538_002600 [Wolbachia pipientis]QZA83912.1 hypothetical protein K1Y75_02540 [Wolbachia pipientis]THA19679.1 hypothetical protein EJE47_05625 [Wolbachia endosymbiont of Aedes albopictus]